MIKAKITINIYNAVETIKWILFIAYNNILSYVYSF